MEVFMEHVTHTVRTRLIIVVCTSNLYAKSFALTGVLVGWESSNR